MPVFRVKDEHLSEREVLEDVTYCAEQDAVISDRAAVTIASYFASPGRIGRVLAGLATGCAVDTDDLTDDIDATLREFPDAYDAEAQAQLAALRVWANTPPCAACGERPWSEMDVCRECV